MPLLDSKTDEPFLQPCQTVGRTAPPSIGGATQLFGGYSIT
jgi:hypothetical protein